MFTLSDRKRRECNGGSRGRALFPVRSKGPKLPRTAVIAIVDDDHSVREALTSLVRSLGYVAMAFERAEDLLNSKRRRSVSCLIADVQMPGMTGLELHDRLVTLGKPIPTILITAFHNESVGSALCRPVWLVISPNRSVRRTCSPVFVRFSDALTRVVRNRGFGMIGALRRVIAAPKANSDEGYGVAAWLCTSSTRPTCAETLLLKHRSRQHRRRGSLAIDLGDDTRPPRRSTANRSRNNRESCRADGAPG